MKAFAAFSPEGLREIDLPMPEPDDYEVLVQNEGCVFCNTTDRMIVERLFGTPAYPVVIGHEDFGIVIKAGKKVKKFREGDRVICANAIMKGFDGRYYSKWGGFAEYGIAGDLEAYTADCGAPEGENAYRKRYHANKIIPRDLPPEKAALAFSLAETASALKQAGDLTGKTVVLIGTGFAGYSMIWFAKQKNAGRIICLGRRESRLEIARKLGADQGFIDPAEAAEYIRAAGGADLVVEASGNPNATQAGLPYLKENGVFAVYAVPPAPYQFDLRKTPADFTVRRISPRVDEAMEEVCSLLRSPRVPACSVPDASMGFQGYPRRL